MSGTSSADYKVPGGKLLRITLTLDEDKAPPCIADISINGDFFMHPESAIEDLEQRLIGAVCSSETLHTAVQAFFDTDVQVIGADVEGIVHAIIKAKDAI